MHCSPCERFTLGDKEMKGGVSLLENLLPMAKAASELYRGYEMMELPDRIPSARQPSSWLESALSPRRSSAETDTVGCRHSLERRIGHAGYEGAPSAKPDGETISAACARCGKEIRILSQSAAGRPVLCEECYLAYQRSGGAI